ncbi:MAG: cobamide remodeling phosphodiesterase CbiR [Thermodesulfobacteriota bacterium]
MSDLPTAYKGRYPFRLACPSFIYPAGYADNVRRLCACVDEIELLLLESDPRSLPRPAEIEELAALATTGEIVFNIHLPTDVFPGDDRATVRSAAVDALLRVIDLARPLAPTSWTLHLPFIASPGESSADPAGWRDRVRGSLTRLLKASGLPAEAIALETLDYPFYYLDPILQDLGCSVCLDTGHLMVREENCRELYRTFRERVIILHIHGVDRGRDHLSLDRLSPDQTGELSGILRDFHHSVSLEVFSPDNLSASLIYLDRIWRNFSKSDNE